MSNTDSVVELLQRTIPEGFYGEVSFIFQDGKVVLIREEKTTKLRNQNDRSDRSNVHKNLHIRSVGQAAN